MSIRQRVLSGFRHREGVSVSLRKIMVSLAFGLITLTVLVACGGGGPTMIRLNSDIQAAQDLNPDPNGRPSPVVVRLYLLRSVASFENADFYSLYERENATLGNDLIAREEFDMQPGETRTYENEIEDTTRYLGVIAAFRNIEKARWRASAPVQVEKSIMRTVKLSKKKKVSLRINIDKLAVSIHQGQQ